MKRIFTTPDLLNQQIEQRFPDFQFPNYLAESIMFISDSFQQHDSLTPWGEPQRQLAYFAYFHTLNVIRLQAVFESLKQVAPEFSPSSIIDFGSGLGASEIAWNSTMTSSPKWNFFETSKEARSFHKNTRTDELSPADWMTSFKEVSLAPDTVIASYSLNELDETPQLFLDCQNLIIVEPSTSYHTRKLMMLRQRLIDKGFHILAPCTHQLKCPLLTHSKRDWCHDRVFFDAPEWFKSLEAKLPMENRTLTFSYLIVSKTIQSKLPENPARVIGDTQKQKGKTRQMVCRGENREFLSWLKKHGTAPEIPHGQLISLPSELDIKGDELRGLPLINHENN